MVVIYHYLIWNSRLLHVVELYITVCKYFEMNPLDGRYANVMIFILYVSLMAGSCKGYSSKNYMEGVDS